MLDFKSLFLVIVSLLIVVKLCYWMYRWKNPKCKGKLPPGSMGFPIIGETFEFMTLSDLNTLISPYLQKRISRYGSKVFRTSLFGAKVIISTDHEMNMMMAKAYSQFGAMESIRRLFGDNNGFLQRVQIHKYIRNLTYRFLGLENIKTRLIQEVDSLSRNFFRIENGSTRTCFDIKEAVTEVTLNLVVKQIIGEMESETVKELGICWNALKGNWFNFGYNFPGTTVYRYVKARKRMANVLKGLIQKKKESKEGLGNFMDILLDEMEKDGGVLDIDKAISLIFTFFVISQESTPAFVAGTVKLVADNPHVMEELMREHEAVVQNRGDHKEAGLTWEEYKSMTFTQMVIKESLRYTSAQPTVHRIPNEDFQIGGYTIPAGWLFIGIPLVHFDYEKYEDPFKFNPWRWKGKDIQCMLSKDYMPFGAGATFCVGSEFAKFITGVFLHHLSTFRWSLDPKTRVLRRYTLKFPAGCKVEITKKTSNYVSHVI